MADLRPAVSTVVHRCLAVKPGEDVLVIVDAATRAIGEALREEASEASADAVLALMDERATDGTEPPRTLAAALARGPSRLRCVHRPDQPFAEPHDRAQARHGRRGARGDDARSHRRHAR